MHKGLQIINQVPVVFSLSSCHYALRDAPRFIWILGGESTSFPIEKHYTLDLKGGLTK